MIKRLAMLILLLIPFVGFGQVEKGWKFIVEGGCSLTTLKPRQPTIITLLYHYPTKTEPGYTTEEGSAFVPSSNFSVIMASALYQFNPYLFGGLGAAYKSAFDKSMRELPLFADIRIDFLNKRTSPTFAIKGGYNLSAYVFGDVSAGIRYDRWPNISWTMNMAISNYQFEYFIISSTTGHFKINNYMLQIRTGLMF